VKQAAQDSAYNLQLKGTEKYADLRMLQSVLLEPLAEALAMVIRDKVQNGELRLGKQSAGNSFETDSR
jgi:hypothetical protein